MKRICTLLTLAVIATAAWSQGFGASNVSLSHCKEKASPATRASIDEGEYIEYTTEQREDGLYLHFKHVNIYFNCATLGAECTATMEGNVITIDECEVGDGELADCYCPFDVTFDVGPLTEGDYTIILTMYGNTLAQFTVHVSTPLYGRFSIDDYLTHIERLLPDDVPVIYDLLGRRLTNEPLHGIYIKNGRKIAVR